MGNMRIYANCVETAYDSRMKTRLSIFVISLLSLVIASPAFASCEVEEVVELVAEELSRRMIKEECDNRVQDAGKCSLSRIIRYAKRDMSADEIYEKCSGSSSTQGSVQPRMATRCDTPYGSCPITFGAGPVGGSCWCRFWNGTAYGVGR